MENELPEGWIKTTIGEVNSRKSKTIDPGLTPEKTFELYSVPIYDSGSPEIVKGSEIKSSKQIVSEDEVLVCKINPRINRVWKVGNFTNYQKIASSEWIVVNSNGVINSDFLLYQFSAPFFRSILQSEVSGVGGSLTRARPKLVDDYSIYLAPLAEQTRIVAKLDAAFGHLETLKTSLARIPELLKKFRQTVLTQAVTGKLTEGWREENPNIEDSRILLDRMQLDRNKVYAESLDNYKLQKTKRPKAISELSNKAEQYEFPQTWSVIEPEHLISTEEHSLGIGPFGSDLKVTDYTDSGTPLIFVRHIKANNFEELNPQYVPEEKAKKLIAHRVKPKDLLITKMGNPPGDCEMYPSNRPDGIITADCIRLRVWDNYYNLDFIKHCINSFFIKEQLGLITKGVAQQKISLERFKTLHFPIPPVEEQQEIASRIEALFAQADALEERYVSLKAKIGKLPQSLLAKAFRGELVPQDPNDEPASAMLKKISEEKESPKRRIKEKSLQINFSENMEKGIKSIIEENFRNKPFTYEELTKVTQISYNELSQDILNLVSNQETNTYLKMEFNKDKNCIEFKKLNI